MRVGDNPSIGPDFNNQASTLTTDEQITNALNVPVQAGDQKAANARRDAVRDIFSNLTPDQAKELYNRLENYNHKDPLNDKFYGTFSDVTVDSLKKSLKARFELQNGGATAQTTGAPQTGNASGAEKKSDVGNVGKTRQDQLNEKLPPKGPDAPLKIAQSKDMDEAAKSSAIREAIRTATPADFQKMVEQSAKWPKDVQDRFDKEIGGGFADLAKRIPTDLKPEQQIEMLKRMHSGGHFYAVTEAVTGADPKVLNQVAGDFKSFPGYDLNNRASRDLIAALANRSKDLSPDNQRKLADGLINDSMTHPSADLTRSLNLTTMFEGMNEAQSRDLFAHIQQNGDLKKMLSYFHEKEPIRFGEDFRGLGQKELQAIKQTFEQLAAQAPSKELANAYRENAAAAQRRIDFISH